MPAVLRWKFPRLICVGVPLVILLASVRLWRLLIEICLTIGLAFYAIYYLVTITKSHIYHGSRHAKLRISKFNFLDRAKWEDESRRYVVGPSKTQECSLVETSSVDSVLKEIIMLVENVFISSWFTSITPNTSFQTSIRKELEGIILNLKSRLSSLDLPELLVIKLLPLIDQHFRHFNQSSMRLNGSYSMNSKLKSVKHLESLLHEGVTLRVPNSNDQKKEKAHFRKLFDSLIPLLLSAGEAQNEVVTSIIRELLSSAILSNVIAMVSEGDFINQMIVRFMGDSLQRRSQVRRLREALEQQTRQSKRIDSIPALSPIIPETKGSLTNAKYHHCLQVIETARKDELKKLESELGSKFAESEGTLEKEELERLTNLLSLIRLKMKDIDSVPSLHEILSDPRLRSLFTDYLKERGASYLLEVYDAIGSLKSPLDHPDTESTTGSLAFANYDSVKGIYERFVNDDQVLSKDFATDIKGYLDLPSNRSLDAAKRALLNLESYAYKEMLSRFYPTFSDSMGDDLAAMHRTSLVSMNNVFSPDDTMQTEVDNADANTSTISPAVFEAVEKTLEQILETKYHGARANSSSTVKSLVSRKSNDTTEKSNAFDYFEQSTNGSTPSQVHTGLFQGPQDEGSADDSENSDDDGQQESDDSDLFSSEILRAAPGDLSLSEKLASIDKEIQSLREQNEILAPLLRKSELTNNVSELAILKRSKQGLDREIASKEFQRQHWIIQENENSLFGKSKIRISSYMSESKNGSDYVLYIIEVQKFSGEDPTEITAGWVVARRFSQFHQLNKYLKRKSPKVSSIKFPTKSVLSFQKSQLLDIRKRTLEQYLQQLLEIPEVCSDPIFRSFLSSENFSFSSFRYPRRHLEDFFGLSLSNHHSEETVVPPDLGSNEELLKSINEMRSELRQFDEAEKNANRSIPFVKPISELLIDVFDLGATKTWVRGRAILVILQQILGSAIEKKIRSAINGALNDESLLLNAFTNLRDTVFPGGRFKDSPILRSNSEQEKTRLEAKAIFEVYMEEICGKLFGSGNTRQRLAVVFDLLQNDFLNKSLILQLIDHSLTELFPELTTSLTNPNMR